jgi:uncharacterized membrane protein
MKYIPLYLLATFIFAIIDYVWITKLGWSIYQGAIGHLFAEKFSVLPAIAFYLLYMAGMFYFAIIPGIEAHSWKVGFMNGALLGLLAYATYDLTNMATLRDWPLHITLIDMLWGTVLTGSISALAVYLSGLGRILS